MKFRSDFVTNSSSSSFIVILDKKPQSNADVKDMLFWDENKQKHLPAIFNYEEWKDTDSIAERIFNDIYLLTKKEHEKHIKDSIEQWLYHKSFDLNSKTNNSFLYQLPFPSNNDQKEIILDNFMDNLEIPEFFIKTFKDETGYDYPHEAKDKDSVKELKALYVNIRKSFDEKINNLACEIYNKLKEKYNGKYFVYFEYSDNDGEEVLEHGGIFRNVPHTTISNH